MIEKDCLNLARPHEKHSCGIHCVAPFIVQLLTVERTDDQRGSGIEGKNLFSLLSTLCVEYVFVFRSGQSDILLVVYLSLSSTVLVSVNTVASSVTEEIDTQGTSFILLCVSEWETTITYVSDRTLSRYVISLSSFVKNISLCVHSFEMIRLLSSHFIQSFCSVFLRPQQQPSSESFFLVRGKRV